MNRREFIGALATLTAGTVAVLKEMPPLPETAILHTEAGTSFLVQRFSFFNTSSVERHPRVRIGDSLVYGGMSVPPHNGRLDLDLGRYTYQLEDDEKVALTGEPDLCFVIHGLRWNVAEARARMPKFQYFAYWLRI